MNRVLTLAAFFRNRYRSDSACVSGNRRPVAVWIRSRGLRRGHQPLRWHCADRIGHDLLAGQRHAASVLRMATYSVLAMLYLAYLGVRGEAVGLLLWPGVVIHAVLNALLGSAWLRQRTTLAT
jgi:hypothetical protein